MSDNSYSPADYAAMSGNGNGFGFGGDGLWLIVLLLFFGGWGGGYGYGGNGSSGEMQRGFDQAATMGGLNGITAALANAEVSRCNEQANILQTMNANQNALTGAVNGLAMNLQNCCCENRASIASLAADIAREACADRAAVSDGVRDLLAATQAQTQVIIDKMCQQEIDALKTQNANLQTQINLANVQASQAAQTAQILANNEAQTANLIRALNPTPVPAYPVANPNACSTGWGTCGCNGAL